MKNHTGLPLSHLHPITSRWGNTLPLTDPRGRLVGNAASIINGFLMFPDDPISAWAFIGLYDLITSEVDDDDFTHGNPRVMKFYASVTKNSLRQFQISIMLGTALLAGAMNKETISLRKAGAIVQSNIDDNPNLLDGKLPRDDRNMRSAFSRYSAGIHLSLGMLAVGEKVWLSIDKDEDSLRKFLSAALIIQALFAARNTIPNWQPWVIDPKFSIPNASLNIEGLNEAALKYASQYRANPSRTK